MNRKQTLLSLALLALLSTINYQVSAGALGTSFTYQGRLNDGANPATGSYDLKFTLYDAPNGGNVVGTPLTNNAVAVGGGLFTVVLNFGPGIFAGEGRWMEIGVCTNGAGAFNTLTPRQPLRATPYSLFAPNAGTAATATNATTAISATTASSVAAGSVGNAGLGAGAVTADKVAAGQMVKSLNGLRDDVSLAAGANIALATNGSQLQISSTGGGGGGWALGGNAGTTPGTDFLGTTDNQPLELRVSNQRGLRLEPTGSNDTVNVIGGSARNFVGAGVVGATIGGGGAGNYMGNAYTNRVEADFGTVSGGYQNTIQTGAKNATIDGGGNNTIQTNAGNATIGGGLWNTIQRGTYAATIGGGYGNNITSNVQFACIPGGYNNAAASYAFAAGNRAKANHTGAFVWADSTGADFASGSDNQFLIRASGGVGIGTNNPQSALHVAGTVTAESFSGSGTGLTEISGAGLADGSVTSAKIADGAVGSAQLASNAVTAVKLDPTIGVWTKSGTNISYSAGNVGLGTTDPQTALHVSGNVQLDIQGTNPGRLILNTVDRNDTARYGIQFKNNILAPFLGDDTQPPKFAFMSGWSDQRTNNAAIRAYGKANSSWGNYLELTHNGTNGFIFTDVGHLVLTPAGNVGIGTTSPATKLDVAGTVQAQTVTITSDREAKQDFAPVDTKEILKRLAALPIQTWTFKEQAGTRHLGPVAQDFYAAFGVGADDKHIATVDSDGAALAAIQGLYQIVRERDTEIGELKRRLAALESAWAPGGNGGAARSASPAPEGF